MRPDPIETAIKALHIHYPDSIGAFVSGSVIRGDATPTSDIDIAVLYDQSFDDIHRFSTTVDDWPIEFFVHNKKAQEFYFEKDRRRGMCIMPTIVAYGVIIPAANTLLLDQQRTALEIIEAGPPVLSSEDIDLRRYAITDQLDDFTDATNIGARNAILSQLHNRLGDFYLRTLNQWSGEGKSLIRVMGEFDPEFCTEFVRSFRTAYSSDSNLEILNLATKILAPYGGRIRDGYYSSAPNDWRGDSV
jgi:hypothetical protein